MATLTALTDTTSNPPAGGQGTLVYNTATAAKAAFTGVTTANLAVGQGGTVAMGNNVISQVAAGVAPTDAANMSQLNNVSEQGRQ